MKYCSEKITPTTRKKYGIVLPPIKNYDIESEIPLTPLTNQSSTTKPIKRHGITFPNKICDTIEIPEINLQKIEIKGFRSHNTTNKNSSNMYTQIELRFVVAKANWIPKDLRTVLDERTKSRQNKKGELIISAFRYKTRQSNYQDALKRLRQYLADAREVCIGNLPKKEKRAYIIHRNRSRRRRRAKKKMEDMCKTTE